MKKPKRVEFLVSFDLPPGCSVAEAQDYVADWVATGKGTLRPPGVYGEEDPGDPMFQLDRDSVKVKQASYALTAAYRRGYGAAPGWK